MLSIMFGTRINSAQDPLVTKAMEIGMEFMDLTGKAPICCIYNKKDTHCFCTTGVWSNTVDFIEPLQWLPTRTRTRARKVHDALIDVYGPMILRVKARLDAGENVEDCLAKTLLLEQEKEGLDWEDICMLAAVFTLGGVHSVSLLRAWCVCPGKYIDSLPT
jgi:Cytochrome P450